MTARAVALGLGSGLLIAAAAAVMFVISAVFNLQIGTRTIVETQYSQAPLAWEETFVREGKARTWRFRWPPMADVTQVQYGLKNLDLVAGRFLIGVVFDDGKDRKDVQDDIDLAPGQEGTMVFNSPLPGDSTFNVHVSVPSKSIGREQEVEVPRTLGDWFSGR